ncbi:MFS transporter (plasmid) [Streptomyces sp. BB1-1-1]|uniref:MFS transporter n=1 Tax=Streptomyces sp. BB1-1-1 TaxID=3074430 RepID=UPI002877C249|nr:MFS transporter [Streptomyces sp. BB1-1-1]WND32883.1 MFS transporter [Streptomyces sp. BB1-1-1]WND40048.1 MFS transporter [Streptomyces sp. BB1-1-1]WND40883.1 MFS transporter [Streptomyces sp. BB1-1-1]
MRRPLADTPQRKIMLGVLLVDTLAAGAFYPLTFLYLTLSTDLPVAQIGLILTGGGLVALVLNPVAGSAADRWGAQRTLVLANACCGLGYLGLVDIHGWFQLVAAVAFISFSQRLYWVGWPVFIAEQVAEGETLDRWFAVVNAFKSAALGLGAATAAVALAAGDVGTLRAILIVAVAASFLSAVVFFRLRMNPQDAVGDADGPGGPDAEPAAGSGGWRMVLGDRPYVAMTVAHTALTVAWLLPSVVLPFYFVDTLGLPPWVPSVAFAVNTAMTVLFQTVVSRSLAGLRRTRAVLVGACAFLLAFAVFAGAGSGSRAVATGLALVGIMLFSVGEMSAGPPAQSLSMEAAPVPLRGRYSSVFQMSWTVSSVGGPAVVGALLQWNSLALWLVLGALVALGGLGFVACERAFPARVLYPESKRSNT